MARIQPAKESADLKRRKANIIAIAVALVLVAAVLFAVLVLPWLTARRAFSEALRNAQTADGTVVLCDPYVRTEVYPETRTVSLKGEEAKEIRTTFLSAFSSYRYVESDVKLAGDLLPYVRFRGEGSAVTFYLAEDSVLVEKGSTYHRFRPAGKDGAAAYAELYHQISDRLAGAE